MAICKRCGAQIEYRTTARGRRMPVDPGKVAIITPRGTVVHGWIVHFATCPAVRCHLPNEVRLVQSAYFPTK